MSRVRRFASAILGPLALMVGGLVCSSGWAESWEQIPVNPRVDIEYRAPKSPNLTNVYETMKARRILEEMQRFLSPLRLPHHLQLVMDECDPNFQGGEEGNNAWYSPDNRSITLCYEFVAFDIKLAPETATPDGLITREAAIVGDLVGTALHESGHMMFHMFNVPVFGREEDAADEMAIYMAMKFNRDIERTIVKGFVYAWSQDKDPASESRGMQNFADEHGTASQRMYNTLCLAYGADREQFQEFVDKWWLPKKRAEHCTEEFDRLKLAFEETLQPFIDQEMMARVRKTDWLLPEELK